MKNYPHGTPSRIPLIASHNSSHPMITTRLSPPSPSNTKTTAKTLAGIAASKIHHSAQTPNSMVLVVGDARNVARCLFNTTAATFHRHTLQHFQRDNGGCKTLLTTSTTPLPTISISSRQHNRNVYNHNVAAAVILPQPFSNKYTTEKSEIDDDDKDNDEYMRHKQKHNDANGEYMFELVKNKNNKQLQHFTTTTENDYDENEYIEDEDEVDNDNVSIACNHKKFQQHIQVPFSIVLLILICYICIGTCIFALWENWSLIDGAYFCFVTLSTIGYGDFIPTRTFHGPEMQLFACCAYLLFGLILVAMSFSILETQLMWKCKRIAVRLKLTKD